MKIILIVQGLIIIAGAYYIYVLRQHDQAVLSTEQTVITESLPIVATSTPRGYTEDVDRATGTAPVQSTAPNDAGMEWPVIETDYDLQL